MDFNFLLNKDEETSNSATIESPKSPKRQSKKKPKNADKELVFDPSSSFKSEERCAFIKNLVKNQSLNGKPIKTIKEIAQSISPEKTLTKLMLDRIISHNTRIPVAAANILRAGGWQLPITRDAIIKSVGEAALLSPRVTVFDQSLSLNTIERGDILLACCQDQSVNGKLITSINQMSEFLDPTKSLARKFMHNVVEDIAKTVPREIADKLELGGWKLPITQEQIDAWKAETTPLTALP